MNEYLSLSCALIHQLCLLPYSIAPAAQHCNRFHKQPSASASSAANFHEVRSIELRMQTAERRDRQRMGSSICLVVSPAVQLFFTAASTAIAPAYLLIDARVSTLTAATLIDGCARPVLKLTKIPRSLSLSLSLSLSRVCIVAIRVLSHYSPWTSTCLPARICLHCSAPR